MFFEMMCSCTATLSLDVAEDNDTLGWVMIHRFASAHINCGYMTPMTTDEKSETRRTERIEDHEKEV